MRLLRALAAALCFAAPLASQAPRFPSDTNAVLKPGDMVKIAVWRDPEMSGDFVVGADGALRHPLYQQVQVAGVPLHVATDRLRQFLTKYQTDPQITVQPLFRVVVGGEVRTPNLLSLPPETTISEAIALAGGPTSEAKLTDVKVVRGGKEYKFDLTNPDAVWANAPIESGDAVVVARRGSFFRDVFLPLVGIIGSAASIVNVIRK